MKQTKMGIRGWVLNALVAAIYIGYSDFMVEKGL